MTVELSRKLESIFVCSEDIRIQLVTDARRFDGVDAEFKVGQGLAPFYHGRVSGTVWKRSVWLFLASTSSLPPIYLTFFQRELSLVPACNLTRGTW